MQSRIFSRTRTSMAANTHMPKSSFIRTVSELTIPLIVARFWRLLRVTAGHWPRHGVSPVLLLLSSDSTRVSEHMGRHPILGEYKIQGFVGIADEKNC